MRQPTFLKSARVAARALILILLCAATARAAISVPHVFGDNMVLQRGQPVTVWGWAAPGETVTVEFAGQKQSARPDESGRWEARLKAMKASAVPAAMTISGGNTIVLTNILVGEVWFCSGQSNMEKPIGEQRGQKPVPNHLEELASGDRFPQIRLFKIEKVRSATPTNDVKTLAGWSVCSSNALETMKFSAVAYFFGRELNRELNVPVGLIESAWGGTRIEPWTPPAGFLTVPKLKALAAPLDPALKTSNTMPTVLFNAMVAPAAGYAIRGALWYQGESNCMDTHDGLDYTGKMEALINGWRKVWGQGNFPFYFVQLAPYNYFSNREKPRVPHAESLPELWEAQTAALRIRHTGMIVITDLVDDVADIHPVQKLEVGQRLARLALARDYGRKEVACSGPVFKSLKLRAGKAILRFEHDAGLGSRDGQPLTWFTIAGADGKFVPADAVIEGGRVVVSSAEVPAPKAVRFAWNELARPNLVNGAGLPAGPFRTDGR